MNDTLLRAVLADPDDDAPRLVLADWLLERGDPRGELIQLQCAQARLDRGDPQHEIAGKRAEALLTRHRDEWTAGLRGFATFARGFVESLTYGRPAAFLVDAPAIFSREPVTGLDLRGRLGESMHTSRPVHGPLAPREVAQLVDSPWLARLRTLRYAATACGAEGAFFASATLAGLSTLQVYDSPRQAVEALDGDALLPRLAELELRSDPDLDAACVANLCRARRPLLTKLHIAECPIEEAGLAALLAAPFAPQLRVLTLAELGVATSRVASLLAAAAPQLVALEQLRVGYAPGSPEAAVLEAAFGDRVRPSQS